MKKLPYLAQMNGPENYVLQSSQSQSTPDIELMRMLGITPTAPSQPQQEAQEVANFKDVGRMPAEQIKLPSVTSQSDATANPSKISLSSNSSYSSPMYVSDGSPRGMITDELLENRPDDYRKFISNQQDAIRGKLAGKDTFSYLDMNPAIALVDSLTGSNLQKGYRAPSGAEGDMNSLNALSKQLADYDDDKEKNRIALLNALKEKTDPFAVEEMRHQNRMELTAMRGQQAQNAGLKPKDVVQIKTGFDKSDRVKNIDAFMDFNNKLQSYHDVLDKMDKAGDNYAVIGPLRAELEKAYNDMSIAYKEHEAKLGALTGPDLSIMKGVNFPLFGLEGMYNAQARGGVASAKKSIKDFQNKAKSRVQKELESLGTTYSTVQGVVDDQISVYNNRLNQMSGQTESKSTGNLADRVRAALAKSKQGK
jgi:hypothetical protein